MGSSVFNGSASSFSVCYTAGATGFTSPTWVYYQSESIVNSCPAAPCAVASSTTTSVPSSTTTTAPPTAITLASFTAKPFKGEVVLKWNTESETDNAGFNLYRSTSEDGEYIKINDSLIPSQGSTTEGASYEFIDNNVQNRKTYYYKLEDIDLGGNSTLHGPLSATPRWLFGIFAIFKK